MQWEGKEYPPAEEETDHETERETDAKHIDINTVLHCLTLKTVILKTACVAIVSRIVFSGLVTSYILFCVCRLFFRCNGINSFYILKSILNRVILTTQPD